MMPSHRANPLHGIAPYGDKPRMRKARIEYFVQDWDRNIADRGKPSEYWGERVRDKIGIVFPARNAALVINSVDLGRPVHGSDSRPHQQIMHAVGSSAVQADDENLAVRSHNCIYPQLPPVHITTTRMAGGETYRPPWRSQF